MTQSDTYPTYLWLKGRLYKYICTFHADRLPSSNHPYLLWHSHLFNWVKEVDIWATTTLVMGPISDRKRDILNRERVLEPWNRLGIGLGTNSLICMDDKESRLTISA